MNGHVVHALLSLLFDDFEHHVRGEVLNALHARDGLVDRNGTDRHGRVAQDRFADFVNIAAGREVHHGVGAVVDRGVQLLEFLVDIRRNG